MCMAASVVMIGAKTEIADGTVQNQVEPFQVVAVNPRRRSQ